LVLVVTLGSLGQTSQTPDLAALEENVAKQFTDLRAKAGMTPWGSDETFGCEWKRVLRH
jgi:hypothetical protein